MEILAKAIMQNTFSKKHTHFLAGTQIIEAARGEFKIYSENWTYPFYHYGDIRLGYYSEVWTDGMDWDINYWLIEDFGHTKPTVTPFLYFEDNSMRNKFNRSDFLMLLDAMLHVRFSKLFKKGEDQLGYYNDTIWNFLKKSAFSKPVGDCKMFKCSYDHNSQKLVEFFIDSKFLPDSKLK